jgi:DNA-binding GntR family transcriptional regulator
MVNRSRKQRQAIPEGSSRSEYVHDRVRDGILQGRYQPGERLRESDLAEWLDVSRTPVREAFHRLEMEGFLTFVPRKGVMVAEIGRQELIELYAIRQALEGSAARLAAQHAADVEIAAFDGLLAQEKAAQGSETRLAEINQVFHESIYSAAHNRYLVQTLNFLKNALLQCGTTISVPGRREKSYEEHVAIIEAIRARDPDSAEAAARAHIVAAESERLNLHFRFD